MVILPSRWWLVSTVAIGCEPGQARKGAAAAADSGAVIRLATTFSLTPIFIIGLRLACFTIIAL